MLWLCRRFGSVTSIKTYAKKAVPKPDPSKLRTTKEDYQFPRRHPIKMNEENSDVISYNIPNRPLSPLYEIPIEARTQFYPYFEDPEGSRIAKIAVIGAVNAGKSSLVNKLVGLPVSVVSRKAHTTRRNDIIAKTDGITQLIFYDTPGVVCTHESKQRQIATLGWEVLNQTELAIFVVDAVKRLREDVLAAASRLQKTLAASLEVDGIPEAQLEGETKIQAEARGKSALVKIPAILVVNKVDLVHDRSHVRMLVKELFEYANFQEAFYVSASTGYGLDKLENYLKDQAEEGEFEFHPLQQTESPDIQRVEDIVRCHLLDQYHDELPYIWMVRCAGWTPLLDGTLRIDVDIFVHSEIQKGILIGRESKCIKKLWVETQADLVKLFRRPIQLVFKGKLMKEFTSKEVYRGADMSEHRSSRLTADNTIPPRLQAFIAPPQE